MTKEEARNNVIAEISRLVEQRKAYPHSTRITLTRVYMVGKAAGMLNVYTGMGITTREDRNEIMDTVYEIMDEAEVF